MFYFEHSHLSFHSYQRYIYCIQLYWLDIIRSFVLSVLLNFPAGISNTAISNMHEDDDAEQMTVAELQRIINNMFKVQRGLITTFCSLYLTLRSFIFSLLWNLPVSISD